jgi:hypothetical protein
VMKTDWARKGEVSVVGQVGKVSTSLIRILIFSEPWIPV